MGGTSRRLVEPYPARGHPGLEEPTTGGQSQMTLHAMITPPPQTQTTGMLIRLYDQLLPSASHNQYRPPA